MRAGIKVPVDAPSQPGIQDHAPKMPPSHRSDTEEGEIVESDHVDDGERSHEEDTYPSSAFDRCDFEYMKGIKDWQFVRLLLEHVGPGEEADYNVQCRTRGTHNYCAILSCKGKERYVIRVPAHGTEELWTKCDAINFRSEVCTMKYIRQKTNVPVPRVHGWNASNRNSLGVPFVIMDFVTGKPAYELWKWTGRDHDTCDYDTFRLRCRLLKNLATVMAELRKLSFDKIGMLYFDKDPDDRDAPPPTVGRRFEADGTTMHALAECSSSRKYYSAAIASWELEDADYSDSFVAATRGFRRFWSIMSEHIPGVKDNAETFVLAHPDSGFQNIICTDDGEITGIIDWEGVRTVPRCAGYAAFPYFLREDWKNGCAIWNVNQIPWDLSEYRELYAECMREALFGINNDGDYTCKSDIYRTAFLAADYGGELARRFLARIFWDIPCLRSLSIHDFLEKLGSRQGWPAAERMLDIELEKMFDPTSPRF